MSTKNPNCPKPFGNSGYVKSIPECTNGEVAADCGPCHGEPPAEPARPGLEWGSSRLQLERRSQLLDPIGRMGLSENLLILPPEPEL